MFARISGSIAGDLVDGGSVEAYPANAWIWSEQTIAAQRRRLGCAPFQSPNSKQQQQQQQQHRTALICRASGRRHKQLQAPPRRPYKYRAAPGGTRHSPLLSLPASSSLNSSGMLHSSSIPQLQQQQQQQAPVDPQQLCACIKAATHYHQLEALCNTFLHNPAFTNKHAALVISRLHKVTSRSQDSQLLLVELLAAKLSSSSCMSTTNSPGIGGNTSRQQEQQLLPDEVAAVCWGFARVGYQADAGLLQHLLAQFWSSFDNQQQPEQQQQQGPSSQQQQQCQQQVGHGNGPALAHLVAGLGGLGFRDPLVWARVRAAAQQVLPDLAAPALQQLLWGLATAQQADAATLDALAAAVSAQMDAAGFDAEGLAQVVWCLHVLGCDASSDLYARASQLMMRKVRATSGSVNSSADAKVQAGQVAASSCAGTASDASSDAPAAVQSCPQEQQLLQAAAQQQQQQAQQIATQPLQQLQRPQMPPTLQQAAPQLQQIALRLPNSNHHQRRQRGQQQSQVPKLLEQTAAALRNAAASQVSSAYIVLQKYDPLLCTLALHRDYLQAAHC